MRSQAFLIELLLSGFFAVACFRARVKAEDLRIAPLSLFSLCDRVERLRRSRWQWFSMVLLLVLLRLQQGSPMMAELTVAAQFVLFLALPTHKSARLAMRA